MEHAPLNRIETKIIADVPLGTEASYLDSINATLRQFAEANSLPVDEGDDGSPDYSVDGPGIDWGTVAEGGFVPVGPV